MLGKVIYLYSLQTWAPTPGPAPPGPPARSVRPRLPTALYRTFVSVRRRPSSSSPPLAVCLLHYLPRRALSSQKTAGAAHRRTPALASAIALRKPSSTPILLFAVSASQSAKIVVSRSGFWCFLPILVAPEKKGSPVFAGFGGF